MNPRALVLIALALANGCGNDACTGLGGTCIALTVDGAGSVDTLQVVLSGATNGTRVAPAQASVGKLPVDVAVQLSTFRGGVVDIAVVGYLAAQPVGAGTTSLPLAAGDHKSARVTLGAGASLDLSAPSDLAVAPDFAACNVVAQNCGPGAKCLLSSGVGICQADGSKTTGQSCGVAGDDCQHGNQCVTQTDGSRNCLQYCASDGDCTQPAASAGATPEPKNTPHCYYTTGTSGVKWCTVPCNPVLAAGNDTCGGNLVCQAWGNGSSGIAEATECAPLGTGGDGAGCARNSDCQHGFGCFTTNGTSRCRLFCRYGNSADCTGRFPGYSCRVVTGWTMFGDCCPSSGC